MGEKTRMQLYPNPTSGELILTSRGGTDGVSKIMVTNLLGAVLHTSEHDFSSLNGSVRIDVGHFANGVYLITVTDNAGNATVKEFVVAK